MLPLARAGFYVVAPDQRGYGRTTGWDGDFDGDWTSFRMLNLVRDALGLTLALGYRSTAAVIGHDFGSPVAAYCALTRPDVFPATVLMSAPFAGPPVWPFNTASSPAEARSDVKLASSGPDPELAGLTRPRKHYQWYYSGRHADVDMRQCSQGVHAFLRAYYHYKSADWAQNAPFPLTSWSAGELAKMPTYYIMDLAKGMAETVAPHMPTDPEVAACKWLSDSELHVYSAEFDRTGFQGGLNWYRCNTSGVNSAELRLFSGVRLDVPSCFIAGKSDWGVYQVPQLFEHLQSRACTRMLGRHLISGAGHWVQQEQPDQVSELMIDFLRQLGPPVNASAIPA